MMIVALIQYLPPSCVWTVADDMSPTPAPFIAPTVARYVRKGRRLLSKVVKTNPTSMNPASAVSPNSLAS